VRKVSPKVHGDTALDQYMYYRTLVVLSRTVLRELRLLDIEHSRRLFGDTALGQIVALYETFVAGAQAKKEQLENEHPEICQPLAEKLARKSILEVETRTLDELNEREMVTPKVYLEIKQRLARDADLLAEQAE
jgi:hypothetical protein